MRQIRAQIDRIATQLALRLLAWVGKRIDPAHQDWLDALGAELDAIDGGIARLAWAIGGLWLIWFERRQSMLNATYRYGPVFLPVLEATLFAVFIWSLIWHYGSLIVILLELAGLCLILAVPALTELGNVLWKLVRRGLATHPDEPDPERRSQPRLPLVLGVLSLATLLVLWLSAPVALGQLVQSAPNAGLVVRAVDHHTADALVEQAASLSPPETYLTTQVKPLAVNGVPLAQVFETMRPVKMIPQSPLEYAQGLQALINKFTGIQGYDLAHGQLPDGVGLGFGPDWGSTGPQSRLGPPGRLLDAQDAGTLNVLIPLEEIDNYTTYNDSTITVQSLVTGQQLNLHVVGEFVTDGGTKTPLFGKILADDSVVQALSGGNPSYAYALHLDMNQRQAVFARLHTAMPTAQIYDFTTGSSMPGVQPSYSQFTRPYPANLWDYFDSIFDPPFQVAIFWAGLLALIVVLNLGARTLVYRSRLEV